MFRKYVLLFVLMGNLVFAQNEKEVLGFITEDDFAKVGVTREQIIKTKEIIEISQKRYSYLVLEKKSRELEIEKYILTGIGDKWEDINKLIDEIGDIEASMLKDRLRSQYEAQKSISQEKYLKAREIALERLAKLQDKTKKVD